VVTWNDIVSAADRLEGIAHRTPVMTSGQLDARLAARVFLKCENLQRIGAFKIRGAYNAISRIPPEDRGRGVLAYSSGNHAQAVALACRLLGIQATIVMPRNASKVKRAATEGYGARVVAYDPMTESREAVARRIQEEGNPTLVPPFDHPHVVAGQGTVARELFEEVGALDVLPAQLAAALKAAEERTRDRAGSAQVNIAVGYGGRREIADAVRSLLLEHAARGGTIEELASTIDVDLIAYDDITLDEPDLKLPHPHLFERAFVLAPLAEIAPDRMIAGIKVRDALAKLDASAISPLPPRLARLV